MSAIVDDGIEPLKVLITLHEGMNIMDAVGPLEVFASAQHNKRDEKSKAFRVVFAAAEENTTTAEGASLRAHMTFEEAMKRLSEVDLLVIPGGGVEPIIKGKGQPMTLIKQFAEIQKRNPSRERTLMSVCTGSFFLADAGILSGLSATTHPDWVTKLEILCSNVAVRDMADRCDVVEHRYVVNNLRFELGEDEDENPYIMSRKEYKEAKRRKSSGGGLAPTIEEGDSAAANGGPPSPTSARRPSNARKGSISLKASNTRRESVIKRSTLRLGGLRVISSSGVTSGIDAALYMVGALVSDDAADETARKMCHNWVKGMVVDGTDV